MFNWETFSSLKIERGDTSQTSTSRRVDTQVLGDSVFVSLLDDYGVISIKGPDASKFLQGQLTCDLNQLDDQLRIYGAHCNPKGRVVYNFTIVKLKLSNELEPCYLLKIHRDNLQNALEYLKRYSVFFKVAVDLQTTLGCFALYNANLAGATALAKEQKQTTVIIPSSGQFIEIWAAEPYVRALFSQLTPTRLPKEHHKATTISLGVADITSDTTEQLLPQEINLQLLDGGISFTKGCYTGQEVIARVHYKGNIKKHMFRCRANGYIDAQEGDKLTNGTSKKVATIVTSVYLGDNTEFLLLCEKVNIDIDDLFWGDIKITKFEWLPLPYAIP